VERRWSNLGAFQECLSRVSAGWDVERLLHHAGEPSSRSPDQWGYFYQQGGLGCVRYSSYTFTIDRGLVVDVNSSGGHLHVE